MPKDEPDYMKPYDHYRPEYDIDENEFFLGATVGFFFGLATALVVVWILYSITAGR